MSGRLLVALPRIGRLHETTPEHPHAVAGKVMPLTARADVFVMANPGHTFGHQSVVIDLGDRQIVLAGNAAFDDVQVEQGIIPGIVESRSHTLATYDTFARMNREKPTLMLFTHAAQNAAQNGEKLSRFIGTRTQGTQTCRATGAGP